MKKKSRFFYYYLVFLLLYFIFVDETSTTSLVKLSSSVLSSQSTEQIKSELWIIFPLFGLQIIFSVLQAGFSDYYFRRKSLLFATIAILMSLIMLKISTFYGIWFLLTGVVIKGIAGNVTPIARAGLADTTHYKNFRFTLALSICAIALGSWVPVYVAPSLPSSVYYIFVLLLVCIAVFLLLTHSFADEEDIPPKNATSDKVVVQKGSSFFKAIKHIPHLIKDESHVIFFKYLNNKEFVLGLFSYLFPEIAFYQIFFRLEVFQDYSYFKNLPVELGLGYFVGTAILNFLKYKNKTNIIIGVSISFFSISILTSASYLDLYSKLMQSFLFGCFSIGFAIFIPSLFSGISQKKPVHEQGKIYGLVDSTDTLASILSFTLVITLKKLSKSLILLTSTIFLICGAISLTALFKFKGIEDENNN